MFPDVTIIILNWNNPQDTLLCLESVIRLHYDRLRILVLDNGSEDSSVSILQKTDYDYDFIKINENKGYAGGNNIGILDALSLGSEYILILNNDVNCEPQMLAKLVQAAESNPQAGILGPLVFHADEPSMIQSAGGKLDRYWRTSHIGQNQIDEGQFNQPYVVDWITGCAMLVRCKAIQQVGLLDEDMFNYFEEVDWCLRFRKAGWQIWVIPQAKIWHKGVQRHYRPRPYVTYYNTRNYLYLLTKHQAGFFPLLRVTVEFMRTLLAWTFKPVYRDQGEHRYALWRGLVDFCFRRMGQWNL